MTKENNISDQIVALSQGLLDGSAPFLGSVLELSGFGSQISPDKIDDDFRVFLVISSETDHFPLPHTRELCAQSWMDKCDLELEEIKNFYRDEIQKSCLKLIKRFTQKNVAEPGA